MGPHRRRYWDTLRYWVRDAPWLELDAGDRDAWSGDGRVATVSRAVDECLHVVGGDGGGREGERGGAKGGDREGGEESDD